jgi:hypothetical protein
VPFFIVPVKANIVSFKIFLVFDNVAYNLISQSIAKEFEMRNINEDFYKTRAAKYNPRPFSDDPALFDTFSLPNNLHIH